MELIYKLLGVATAAAEEAAAAGDVATEMTMGQSIISLLFSMSPILIMVLVMYFLMIRPEKKRKKEAEEQRSNMKNGDQVTTIGGIVGTVVDIKSDKFVLETGADQVRIEFTKWALSTNETAAAAAKEEAKKKQEQRAKEKAAKKAEKNK